MIRPLGNLLFAFPLLASNDVLTSQIVVIHVVNISEDAKISLS